MESMAHNFNDLLGQYNCTKTEGQSYSVVQPEVLNE